jgi:hypothetical protein
VAAFLGLHDNGFMLDRLIAETEANAEDQKRDAERFVLEQGILDEQAPGIWKRLRALLKDKCQQYPKHLKFEVCGENEAIIRGSSRVLEAKFLRKSKVVVFECGGGSGCCTFRLNRQNIAVLCDGDGVLFPSEEYAAEQLLALILRIDNRR